MFRIISSSRHNELLEIERKHLDLQKNINFAYRWLSEFTHLEPLWEWLKNESHYGISTIRDEIRSEYYAELSRKGYYKGN